MNKTVLAIAIVGILTLFTSAYYSAPADSRIGYKAPALLLGNSNNDLSPLQQHRGGNVLLTFWSSVDAQSRLDNMHYDRLSREAGAAFTHVSVNMDRSVSVFNSVVAIDNLDRSLISAPLPRLRMPSSRVGVSTRDTTHSCSMPMA